VTAAPPRSSQGEVYVATTTQLQLWSINGTLLACSSEPFPAATSLTLAPTPEWMVEQLPTAATGHADGSVRWWAVREPTEPASAKVRALPRCVSLVPVPGHVMPAWDLVERRELRVQAARGGVPVTALSL
jgi:hypothetical protein